jgi:hypothetical protein
VRQINFVGNRVFGNGSRRAVALRDQCAELSTGGDVYDPDRVARIAKQRAILPEAN